MGRKAGGEGTRFRGRRVWLLAAVAALSGCGAGSAVLDPEGPAAERVADLGWFMFAVSGAITLVVFALLAFGLFRRRGGDGRGEVDRRRRPRLSESAFIAVGGIALPTVVLLVLSGLTVSAMDQGDDDGAIEVEVVGYQYWWEFRLPEEGVVTANELTIPVGRPVELTLRSDDVIHSFWVPQLAGKIDMVPGRTNELTIEADEPGVYRGQCAEFCGVQHAQMALYVEAVPPDEYEAWVRRQAAPAEEPTEDLAAEGAQVFLDQPCAACHAIRGTPADADVGPDLTHFASRRSIGARAVPNNRGNLAGWMVDSQSIKPGNLMPPVVLSPDELRALLAYLETLE